ncbi:MAG TPA: SGNH/GDSL hydrolase family protein [Acidimicrobiia bacterium]
MVRKMLRRGAVAGFTLIGLEAAYALLRPAPLLEQFDPSGEFGDPTNPTLRIAVLGDSSVTAPGVAGPHEAWVSLTCSRLADSRHVILKSFAVGGSTARTVIAQQLAGSLDFGPDVVFVSVGANDAIKGVPLNRFEENLNDLIGALVESGAVVVQSGVGFLGTIPRLHPPLSTLMERRARRFDDAHRRVAEIHGTAVVDQRGDDASDWRLDRSLWAEDFFHVSAAGHARWAETVWETVGPLLNGSREQG